MKLRVAFLFGLLFVACVSLSSAEDPKAEPESAAEPESEPEHTAGEEDAQGAGSSVGKSGEAKAQKNPAAVPIAFPASVIFAMAAVAKYVL